jgi:hypothetical protein
MKIGVLRAIAHNVADCSKFTVAWRGRRTLYNRKLNHEFRPRDRSMMSCDVAPMQSDNGAADRKAEADSGYYVPVSAAVEFSKHGFGIAGWQATAFVGDSDLNGVPDAAR